MLPRDGADDLDLEIADIDAISIASCSPTTWSGATGSAAARRRGRCAEALGCDELPPLVGSGHQEEDTEAPNRSLPELAPEGLGVGKSPDLYTPGVRFEQLPPLGLRNLLGRRPPSPRSPCLAPPCGRSSRVPPPVHSGAQRDCSRGRSTGSTLRGMPSSKGSPSPRPRLALAVLPGLGESVPVTLQCSDPLRGCCVATPGPAADPVRASLAWPSGTARKARPRAAAPTFCPPLPTRSCTGLCRNTWEPSSPRPPRAPMGGRPHFTELVPRARVFDHEVQGPSTTMAGVGAGSRWTRGSAEARTCRRRAGQGCNLDEIRRQRRLISRGRRRSR